MSYNNLGLLLDHNILARTIKRIVLELKIKKIKIPISMAKLLVVLFTVVVTVNWSTVRMQLLKEIWKLFMFNSLLNFRHWPKDKMLPVDKSGIIS